VVHEAQDYGGTFHNAKPQHNPHNIKEEQRDNHTKKNEKKIERRVREEERKGTHGVERDKESEHDGCDNGKRHQFRKDTKHPMHVTFFQSLSY
jgi:hypothetical protein